MILIVCPECDHTEEREGVDGDTPFICPICNDAGLKYYACIEVPRAPIRLLALASMRPHDDD
jgi:hypothetical protein